MEYFSVKNWRKFQHYTDRNPPWIKLHFEMLSSSDWVMLDDRSRVLAVACMLVASRNEGRVPVDPAYLKRVAYLNKTPDFKPLIRCGFLESASTCKQTQAEFRPETETYTKETETETEHTLFGSWYLEYPRKESKQKAREAWSRVKNRPTLDTLLTTLAWQKKSEQWTKEGGKYVPLPATYINARKWEDEPTQQAGDPGTDPETMRKFLAGELD